MSNLVKIHNHIEEHEGPAAAKRWLLANVAHQDDAIKDLRKQVSALKSRVTRIRNERRLITTDHLTAAELSRLRETE